MDCQASPKTDMLLVQVKKKPNTGHPCGMRLGTGTLVTLYVSIVVNVLKVFINSFFQNQRQGTGPFSVPSSTTIKGLVRPSWWSSS